MTLVEDIERYSMACVGPQCKLRIASGISLMAWVDELWKGRVDEAADTNAFMGELRAMGLCPDPLASRHVRRGVPDPSASPHTITTALRHDLRAQPSTPPAG